ncbi:hypothetical protein IGK74_002312 [Enterococcus sp. AZ150]|uniref:single-stranded DNA-binding protein n=1 Tax=Enterococcus sp. AZ150 TaxID=2774866 RepID=UPI003F1EE6C9
MQSYIATGYVSKISDDSFSFNGNGTGILKFDFMTVSNYYDPNTKEKLNISFHVETYSKQAEYFAETLFVGCPILLKGEIVKRSYVDSNGERKFYEFIFPDQNNGITFMENKEQSELRRNKKNAKNIETDFSYEE